MPESTAEREIRRQGALAALARAAKRAEALARATRTPLVLWEDGKVKEVWVGEETGEARVQDA